MGVKKSEEATLQIIRLIQKDSYGLILDTGFLLKRVAPIIDDLVKQVKCEMIVEEINRIDWAVCKYKRAIEFRT